MAAFGGVAQENRFVNAKRRSGVAPLGVAAASLAVAVVISPPAGSTLSFCFVKSGFPRASLNEFAFEEEPWIAMEDNARYSACFRLSTRDDRSLA